MQINEIHQLNDNQPVHSSKAVVDKIRGSGGPHSVNVTSQWLLILTPTHSPQCIIVLLLICDLSLYDQALRPATKWQQVLKKTFNISAKILLIFTLQSQKNSTLFGLYRLLTELPWDWIFILTWVYLSWTSGNKMYKLWILLKLDMFSVFIFAYIHSPPLPLSMSFFALAAMS